MALKTALQALKDIAEETAYLVEYSPDIARGFYYQWAKHIGAAKHSTLEDVIEEVKAKTHKDKFNIIGHSFGGLVGLAYTMENPDNVARYLTIGTPFKGTPIAYGAIILLNLGVIPYSAKQLVPENDFVKALSKYFREHNEEFENKGILFENIRSKHDEFVPFEYSSLKEMCPEAKNITEYTMQGKGHVTIAHNEHVYRHIANIVASTDLPTIFIPGFGLNGGFFERVLRGVKEAYPGLISDEKMANIFHLAYDYTKPIKTKKIITEK
ncbi:MAG: alpha/beta fold hydrolase [Candidatus Nanoarchaeia archaeon]|nr:alpha/beta fold hydrolase [Candidatus Nanoarchaeia archaeon]